MNQSLLELELEIKMTQLSQVENIILSTKFMKCHHQSKKKLSKLKLLITMTGNQIWISLLSYMIQRITKV